MSASDVVNHVIWILFGVFFTFLFLGWLKRPGWLERTLRWRLWHAFSVLVQVASIVFHTLKLVMGVP